MHFSYYVLATSLGAVCAKTYYASYDASLGNSNANDIAGIEYREIRDLDGTTSDSGWKPQASDDHDGFDLARAGQPKAGYRRTDDDSSAIVWAYDTSITKPAHTATWSANDTSVDAPDIGLEFFFSATFSNVTSSTSSEMKRQSDPWTATTFTVPPWQPLSIRVTQDSCPSSQDFTITVTDTSGTSIGTASGHNAVDLTIPVDAGYPVEVVVEGGVGSVSTVLSRDEFPIKFALGDGDDVPTQTFQYLLEFDFCPDYFEDE